MGRHIKFAFTLSILLLLTNISFGQTKLDYLKSKLSLTLSKIELVALNNSVSSRLPYDIYHTYKDLTVISGTENNDLITLEGKAIFTIRVFDRKTYDSNPAAPSIFKYKATFKKVLDDYEVNSIELIDVDKVIKLYQ